MNRKKVSVEHAEKIKVIVKVFRRGEIAKYLLVSAAVIGRWIEGATSPRRRYHKAIDLLYSQALERIDTAPDTVEVKTNTGELITMPHIFKL